MLVDEPKVKPPVADVLDVIPNVGALVVAGVPKVEPVNKGADVLGVGNKVAVVVIVVGVLDPNSKPLDCACVDVAGVLPNPKLRPIDVDGVERAPNVDVPGVVLVVPNVVLVVPNDVLPKPKPVVDLNNRNKI